jgi:K+-sensing histidine kinase KdpD
VTTREAKFKRKDGKEITVAITLASVKNQRGVIIFMDSIVENITERKIAEEEKSLAAERLQELYQVEKNQRQELEEESAARGLFIDILGHELRTPLTPILASTSMLQDILNAQPDSVSTKLISNISQGMETLANRLEELLDVGKFSRGVFQIKLYPVDLKKYFENIVNRLKPVIDQRQQQLVIKTADDLPVAMIDPGCLDKVIINLLANCSKFNPNKVKITLSVKIEGDHLRVGVSDELMEISAEEQERLFRPYHRVEQDRQKYSGAGLGLAICKQIIEAHHGKIWISSETGKGSVFNFIIPLKSPEWLVERK